MRCFAAGAAVVAAIVAGAAISADGAAVPYPDGYRAWRHVKSMVIEPGHALHASFGGIHHLYANDKAMKGYESGHFPDGAVIVF
ncbi:MAG: cytochrome P460 family protein, partial [Acidobacteria bacterium]|nr:cytochrome P460 family protein [Acidobacteriota bacterium]